MDKLVRASDKNGKIRAFGAITTDISDTARKIHGLTPVVTAGIGRAMTACLMMGMTLKSENESLSLQFKGDGPVGLIVTVADSLGHVRGYVGNGNVQLPLKPNGKLDVGGSIGSGYLTVIRDMKMKEPYIGRVELVSGEIAEDLTYYFASSEQVPSIVALGVLVDRDLSVKASGGYIIQLMPDAGEDEISVLEKNISDIASVTSLIESGLSIEEIIQTACRGFDMEFTEEKTPEYKCNCSRERIERALISIGKDEIRDILENEGKTSLNCYFCNTDYEFDGDDLKRILNS